MKFIISKLFLFIRQTCAPPLSACFFVATFSFISLVSNPANLGAAVNSRSFPTFPAIEANVDFWEKIYSKYSTSEAVLHDRNDLTKIYGVIPIIDYLLPGAPQLNKPFIERSKQKYIAILTHLAQGHHPITKEERRIAAMHKGAGKKQLLRASESIRAQIGQKERFRAGVVRSGAYMPEIKRIFRSLNLPEELAYLPHVESSFNPDAHSKAGASGLWQFTRSTGKNYLRIDHIVDERRDPILASHAAAKFLKRNHTVLGSWPLALTAYNYGTSGMARAKKSKGSYERIFLEYNEGYFKFASRNFYPSFLAAIKAAQKLEKNPSLQLHKPLPTSATRHLKRASTATIRKTDSAIKPSFSQEKKQPPNGYRLTLQPHQRAIKNKQLL